MLRLPLRMLGLAAIVLVLAATAQAEPLRVSGRSDPDAVAPQARQQALQRAFVDAVVMEAQRLLPGPLPESRLAALRDYLSPRAMGYILSYQEVAKAQLATADGQASMQPSTSDAQAAQAPSAPLEITIDAEVNGRALRPELIRLGLFSGAKHPRFYRVSFGRGVKESDFRALDGLNVLLGLQRSGQAAVDVTLERLPQGYYKAVLRHGAQAIAADAGNLSDLWLDAWGRLFASLDRQSAGAAGLVARGFANVDGVMEFSRMLAGWEDAVQGATLASVELSEGDIVARWALRVVSRVRLDAHLGEYLPGRGLTVVQDGGAQPAAAGDGRAQ
jgi:hypothetical protein